MFEFLRKGATSLFAKVFLGIIVIVFIFWGIGSFTSFEKDIVASVNGEKITLREFQEYYNFKLLQLKQTFGDISPEDLQKMKLKEEVLQELIQLRLIKEISKELGLKVSSEEVKFTIANFPFFQDKGVFNQERFRDFLRNLGLTQASFEKLLEVNILQQKLKTLLISPLLVSKDEVKDFANFYYQRLILEEYYLPLESCIKEVKFDERGLENYYLSNRDRYIEKAKVKLVYLKLPLKGEVDITEEEIKSYYSQNLNRFKEPFKVKLRMLVFQGTDDNTLKIAQEAKAQIKSIRDFDKFNVKKGEWFEEGELPSEIKWFVKQAKIGDLLGPFRTSQGYVIVGVEEVQPERFLKLEDVKTQLKEEIKRQKLREKVLAQANELYAKIVKENGVVNFAKKEGQKLEETAYLDEEDVAKLFSSREIAHRIFKQGKGDYFSPLETKENIYLIEILDKKAPRNLSFDEVKEKVKKDYIQEKGRALCEIKIKDFIEKSKTEKDLRKIAMEMGLKMRDQEMMRAELLENQILFGAQGLFEKPIWTEKEIKVVFLKDIMPPDKPLSEKDLGDLKNYLLTLKAQIFFKKFMDNYQKRAKIKIYPLFEQI